MLGAGQLKEQIIITRTTSTSDGMGGVTLGAPVTILSTTAKVSQQSISNDLIAQSKDLIEAYEFTIRRRNVEIKGSDLIQWRGRDFEIIGFPGFIDHSHIIILAKTSNNSTDGQV